ncbi:hypothetical protein CP532_1136, partial [Ophiocordyceps camponoti-leonardi (nom. inval.)]
PITRLLLCFVATAASASASASTSASSTKPPPPISLEAQTVCSVIQSKYPNQLIWNPRSPSESAVQSFVNKEVVTSYLNVESLSQRPACVFLPSKAEQVSFAVRTLNSYPSVRFGLKSGGHNPNVGFSTAIGGLLIAFRPNLRSIELGGPDSRSVVVGAGCKWKEVYAVLQPTGKTVVGARAGDVGVTGSVLGGGLSYLSAQYGLACDNVISFECVLANGTIATASPTSHRDLFFALRGGGNQFAIVTRMILRTVEVGQDGMVWGGMRIYATTQSADLRLAIANFTANVADPKAAVYPFFTFGHILGFSAHVSIVFYFYNGPDPGSVFQEFDRIPFVSGDLRRRTYESLHQELLGGEYHGARVHFRMQSFPNLPPANTSAFLDRYFQAFQRAATAGSLSALVGPRVSGFSVEPVPRSIAQIGGTNALSMDPRQGDRLWIFSFVAWTSTFCNDRCPAILKEVSDSMLELHKREYAGIRPTNYVEGDDNSIEGEDNSIRYNPIFMNQASHDQRVLQSYGDATYQRLKAIHKAYDPQGLFSKRQGGFRFAD